MSSKKYSLKERLRYSFENTMSKGTIAIIGWLAIISLLIILLSAGILYLTQLGGTDNVFEALWVSLMRTMDSGNVAGDEGWKMRGLMLLVTLGGIFIVSTLIGTLTSGMEGKMEDLRKGRSKVLESDHTLILGWSGKVFSTLSELIIANENQKKPRIVILADKDKVEMEDEIRSRFPTTGNTKIICRSGSPLDLNDLELVAPHDARSIIILAPEEENADNHVIKSILAITNNPNRKKEKYHIVAEISEEENMEAAELVSNDEAVLVLAGDLIARVTAQTCRQSGLSVVYTELLDFDGAEIYFKAEAPLIGKTYKEALFAYEESTVMGLFHANGEVSVNPPADTVLKQGDQVIAISEDDDTIRLSGIKDTGINLAAINENKPGAAQKERTLILGWNKRGNTIIRELDGYVAADSEVIVVAETDETEEALQKLQGQLKKITLSFRKGNITGRALLNELDAPSFNHIIILCYQHMEMQEADSKTLICLLHLRSISEKSGKDLSIVSEMLDVKNRELAEVTKADDFIVSDKLISLMLSQLSENKHLKKVFDDLFSSEGSELYLKPAIHYIQPGQEVNFYTLIESALKKGETALGYRIAAHASDPAKQYGIVINPKKSDKFRLSENDRIIVLAED